ncbi:MAG TPA: EamA family transporter [Gammaproteobacteria bacterium]|nr:EamA family transporter [Gammaproteobacteria bacterium]
MTPSSAAAHSRLALVAAFAIVYVVWGSTYLAIRFAIETLPPFLMAASRFLVAGAVLYLWARLAGGAERPGRPQWLATGAVGLLLLLGGNGLVVWSELKVPSGVAALIVALVPVFMVLVDWLRPGGSRPSLQVVAGLALGIAGVAWLVGPDSLAGGGRIDLIGAGALVLACLSWSLGSIYQRHAPMPGSPSLSTAMQMLAGGAGLFLIGVALGEPRRIDVAAFSLRSVLGFAYLIVFGSILAFSAYIWLLKASTPARVSTYAYVNPVVAVLLGWALADEPLTPRMLVAAAVIVGGVALITLKR